MPRSIQRLCQGIESAHDQWQYKMWTDANIEPLIDALSPIAKHWYSTYRRQNLYAMAVDILRLHALHQYGGVYMDCDFQMQPGASLETLLQPHVELALANKSVPTERHPYKMRLQNCFIASTKAHPFIDHLCRTVGHQQYELTTLTTRKTNVAFNCQFLTTEYRLFIDTSYQGKLPIDRIYDDIANLVPPTHYIIPANYLFGEQPIIAKHLYYKSHSSKRRQPTCASTKKDTCQL